MTLPLTPLLSTIEGSYLLDYTALAHTRSTPGFEALADGQYYRPYAKNTIRPHATQPHMYRFDPITLHMAGDNLRGLMNRSFNESTFSTSWTAVNCVPEWFYLNAGFWQPIQELTPIGEQATECVVPNNGDATLTHLAANNGGVTTVQTVFSVFVKLAAGQSAPANGVQLIASTNSGASTVTKDITPTSSWVRHFVTILPAGSPARLSIILKLPNATAGDRVMFAVPEVVQNGRSVNWWAPTAPHPYLSFSQAYTTADGDNLTVPAVSVPTQMRGLGGDFGFRWIPTFDSTSTSDVTFFSCGNLYREILWPPARDGSIWVRASNSETQADPYVKSYPLVFTAGDLIEVKISPTTGRILVSGCSGSGNGYGPASWSAGNGFGAGSATPYTWDSNEMIVGDRHDSPGYTRGSHMGCGYLSEPYVVAPI